MAAEACVCMVSPIHSPGFAQTIYTLYPRILRTTRIKICS